MPSFSHIIIGLGISIFLYKITEGKFSSKHSLVFTLNTLFGPDLSTLLPTIDSALWGGFQIPEIYYFFHDYGWPIVALLLTFPWMFVLKTVGRKNPEKNNLSFMQVFYIITAAGLFHLFVDIIGHPSYIMLNGVENTPWGAVWVGWNTRGEALWVSITDILGTGMFPCGNRLAFPETYIFTAIMIVVIIVTLFFYSLKNEKTFIRSFYIITLIFAIPLIIFYFIPDYSGVTWTSDNYYGFEYSDGYHIHAAYRLVGGEADLGIMLYFMLFLLVPLYLIYRSILPELEDTLKEIEQKKAQKKAKKLEKKRSKAETDLIST